MYTIGKFIISSFADEIDAELEKQMDLLEQLGIWYIEIRGVNGKNIVQHSLKEVELIKKRLDERGFKISAVGSPIGKIKITDEFSPHIELFKHTIEIAKILGTKYIRMFSFYIPSNENPELYKNEVICRWREFINMAEGSGLVLLHENEKGIYADIPERCIELVNALNCDYFKLIFDPANFVQCGVETYPHAYNLLERHIEYIHIKDAVSADHHVVPAGFGDGRIKEIIISLFEKDFNGFLSLEPHLASFAGFASLEQDSKADIKSADRCEMFKIAASSLGRIFKDIKREKR
jgi:Sugar phosphate isomerases/epimerases